MLSKRLKDLKEKILSGNFKYLRATTPDKTEIYERCKNLSAYETCYEVFHWYLLKESPVILHDANFAFCNSFKYALYPMIVSGKDMPLTSNGHPVNGSFVKNLSPNWENLLLKGLKGILEEIDLKIESKHYDERQLSCLENMRKILLEVVAFQHRHLEAALAKHEKKLIDLLARVPYEAPATFHEALQSIYFMFNMIRISQSNHIGFHRIDQYLLKFYKNDLKKGILTESKALELVEEFFLMLNIDTDLYSAIQPGDSGMTVMLGGLDKNGKDKCNELTKIFLKASEEVAMLEPKINLRVHKTVPDEVLDLAANLTKKSLGYPQYCNDEVIIPGLCKFGYDEDDAYDYTVAACWEFVVKHGMDTPNAFYLDMPLAVDNCIRYALKNDLSFKEILKMIPDEFKKLIEKQLPSKVYKTKIPNLLFSALEPECVQQMEDSLNVKGWHYNYGCHGVGSSTAVDSLLSIKKLVYDEQTVSKDEFFDALENDFKGHEALYSKLNSSEDKLCTDNEEADKILKYLFDSFAKALSKLRTNGRRIRPGTGSAQFYTVLTQGDNPELKATADGRKTGDYISSSLAPSPKAKVNGILSVLQAYRHIDYMKICNGGPITTEINKDVFKDDNSKFIGYIKAFIKSENQQMQINLLDKATLIDAQKHPELHKNLIVRVWGWSGYFIQLDKKYQDQIISRNVYN